MATDPITTTARPHAASTDALARTQSKSNVHPNSVQRPSLPRQLGPQPQYGLYAPQLMSSSSTSKNGPMLLQASSSGPSTASVSTLIHSGEPARRGRGGVPRRRRVDAGVDESEAMRRAYTNPVPISTHSSSASPDTTAISQKQHVGSQRHRAPSPAPTQTAHGHAQSPSALQPPTPGTRTRIKTLDRFKALGRSVSQRRATSHAVVTDAASNEHSGRQNFSASSQATGKETRRGKDMPYTPTEWRIDDRTGRNNVPNVSSSNEEVASQVTTLKPVPPTSPKPPSKYPGMQIKDAVPVDHHPLESHAPVSSEGSVPTPEPRSSTSKAEGMQVERGTSVIDDQTLTPHSPPLSESAIPNISADGHQLGLEVSKKDEAGVVDRPIASEDKPESATNFWAKRMQNLMSGLSFSTANSSRSSSSYEPSETQIEPSSKAPTTVPSLSSRGPSKSTRPLPPLIPTSAPSAPQITTARSLLSPTANLDLPQVQQQKNAVQSAAKLAALLAGTREMNNSIAQGASSSWNVLGWLKQPFSKGKDKLSPSTSTPATSDSVIGSASTTTTDTNADMSASERAGAAFAKTERANEPEGARDVMLYAPLIPDSASTVEIASSEVVTLYDEESKQERAYRSELRRRWAEGREFISRDAMRSLEGVSEGVEDGEDGDDSEGGSDTETEGTAKDGSGMGQEFAVRQVEGQDTMPSGNGQRAEESEQQPRVREKVIWKPSPTQISVQILWWGYRIYLPPPVLEQLNNTTIEAAKRAALLTAALRWLLENLPSAVLPIQLRPVVALLQYLVPLLGAIGTFISWSWRAIGTFDKGYGVVLSATWFLPVVLVPGTWETGEVPCVALPSVSSQIISAPT